MKVVAIEIDGIITIHIPDPGGNYSTLCGLDGFDTSVGQQPADIPPGAKIDCDDCRMIWKTCLRYNKNDFGEQPNPACTRLR